MPCAAHQSQQYLRQGFWRGTSDPPGKHKQACCRRTTNADRVDDRPGVRVFWVADYDPYGRLQGAGGTASSTFTRSGYAGQHTDPAGLPYHRARYHDPGIAQFLTIDRRRPTVLRGSRQTNALLIRNDNAS